MPSSFAPLVEKNTEILIIGSMPGEASLTANEYYAFKHNAFWKIIAAIYNHKQDFIDYEQKITCLHQHKTGLWDSLQYCEREGSLDSDIRCETPNDFKALFATLPRLKKLLFNGQKAFQFFKKYHKDLLEKYEWAILPSTSPANATFSFDRKLALWQKELNFEGDEK